MTLSRHLESLAKHAKAGNMQSAKQQAESLKRMYASKAAHKKIDLALKG